MYKGKSIACVIPARMSSSRFPGKPLVKINGRELVLRVADIANESKYVDRIIIATEDLVIKSRVESEGYEAMITSTHYTCTHRVAEVASHLREDYIFNLQGDEPLADPKEIEDIITFGIDNDCDMVQPYKPLVDSEVKDPDCVQMIVNNGKILHLQREPDAVSSNLITQVGMYFYKREVVTDFPNCDMTWVKYWKGLDTIGFCGKYDVIPFKVSGAFSQAIDRPHHIQIVEQILMELNE
tara:strand:- start:847 stop:1563 length:717 start_codon:yes stop_codon:yes gene_type:complete